MNTPLLQIRDLHTDIETRNGVVHTLPGVNLRMDPGETLGIVDESRSSKTMTALSLMDLLPQGGKAPPGSIILDDQDLTQLPLKERHELRGTKIGMIFRDPLISLSPAMKTGLQVCGSLHVHEKLSKREALARAIEIFKHADVPRPKVVIDNYPHQLSGGVRQHVVIAMALVCKSRILTAGEPTTTLGMTTQIQTLNLIGELCDEYRMGIILITHDPGVVAGHTDRIAVMHADRIVKAAPAKTLFTKPGHRYTNSLIVAPPERTLVAGIRLFSIPGAPPSPTSLPVGCRFVVHYPWTADGCRAGYPDLSGDETHIFSCFHLVQEGDESLIVPQGKLDSTKVEETTSVVPQISHEVLLNAKEVSRKYGSAGSDFFRCEKGVVSAVDRVSITVRKGETYGLVGELDYDKSTMGRLITGLEPPSGDAIGLDGRDLATPEGQDAVRIHRGTQMMFRDSCVTTDLRVRIDQIPAGPMNIQRTGNTHQIAEHVMKILEQVGLVEEILDHYPHEFSGGQLRHISFTRSLTLTPDLIITDEPVSAPDISAQAQVLNLTKDPQQELSLSYLFISHDLAVVQCMADHTGVVCLGHTVEKNPAHEIVKNPKCPYMRTFIDSILVPDSKFKRDKSVIKLTGESPNAVNPPEGYRSCPHCSFAGEEYEMQPMLTSETHHAAYHHPPLALSVEEDVNA